MKNSFLLPFWKVQSIGNDFPLIHLEDAVRLNLDLTKLSIELSERHRGIGGDGLLVVSMEGADVRLRMFNPDGTEDFCGNGIRCAADHAFREGWVNKKFNVLHQDRVVPCEVEENQIKSVIGIADYTPENVPVIGPERFNTTIWSGMDGGMPLSLFGSTVTTGSTHTIIPTSTLPDDESFVSVSAKIEYDPQFPKRTSVIWVRELEPDHLAIRIWERGVGETMGCGTGSSAAVADYLRRKGRGGSVTVNNPGGKLVVRAEAWNAPLEVIGAATEVFRGIF